MNTLTNDNLNYLETLISIFSIKNGEVKILLEKAEDGNWKLPSNYLKNLETLEYCINNVIKDRTGLTNVKYEQAFTFSNLERSDNTRILATSFIGLVDNNIVESRKNEINEKNVKWFNIYEVPNMVFDHNEIVTYTINYFKKKMTDINSLKKLFSYSFTLPELQKVYEQILGKKLDRRNFRKKFISLDFIEDTNEFNIGCNGRPAKLYKFKDDEINIDLI